MREENVQRKCEFQKIISAVENQEFWTLNSTDVEVHIKNLCHMLNNFTISANFAKYHNIVDVLAFVKLSSFLQVLLSLEAKNTSLFESIESDIRNSKGSISPSQHVIICRSKLICSISLYFRVFSEKRLELILRKLKEIE